MPLISVPTIESALFYKYFETVWYIEMSENYCEWYEKQKIIVTAMEHYQHDASAAAFQMLIRAHDIIYDRE
jgi:hypothetical protein